MNITFKTFLDKDKNGKLLTIISTHSERGFIQAHKSYSKKLAGFRRYVRCYMRKKLK